MKLKEGFIVREVAGQIVVLPAGEGLDLNMMITLNSTGKFLWERLEQECTEEKLAEDLLKEYDVDAATARKSVAAFVEKLREHGFLA